MEGPGGVVSKIEAALRLDMPAKLAELRIRYGIEDGSLEDITRYLTTDPDNIAIDKPPIIIIVEQDSDTVLGPMKLTTDGAGGSMYEFRYRIGVFAWARGKSKADTALTRQRYGLAVREVLLQRLGLGDPDPGTLVLDPSLIQESYSPVSGQGTSREVIAGTALMLNYRSQEYLPPRRSGVTVGTITVGGSTGP